MGASEIQTFPGGIMFYNERYEDGGAWLWGTSGFRDPTSIRGSLVSIWTLEQDAYGDSEWIKATAEEMIEIAHLTKRRAEITETDRTLMQDFVEAQVDGEWLWSVPATVPHKHRPGASTVQHYCRPASIAVYESVPVFRKDSEGVESWQVVGTARTLWGTKRYTLYESPLESHCIEFVKDIQGREEEAK